ncbi:MAG: prepilin-type N-terminal cleavage/methylation domain-containing protein [Opitutaceae bacterium]|jgi:general secretion pathway protein G|nr:prepilin-type N-terminal cleavage/methylation domain-containing protein [Opitutaceae bacterium]
MYHKIPTRIAGFTLVELLTVIAIIGILAAIIIPVAGKVRDSARNAQCLGNLRQTGVAARLYIEDNKGMSPPTSSVYSDKLWPYAYSIPLRSRTSPQDELPNNLTGTIFECPKAGSDTVTPRRSYGMNGKLGQPLVKIGEEDGKPINAIRMANVTIPSQAPFFGDSKASSAFYGQFANPRHNGKANICFADGHAASLLLTEDMLANDNHSFWKGEIPKP